jgi:protein phosphatase
MRLELAPDEPIAIISDIHGNITALNTVLNDIQARGLKNIICLGDLVGKGPSPRDCVDRIRELQIPTVIGNWDLIVASATENNNHNIQHALEWQREQLGSERLAYLHTLPYHFDLERHAGLVRLLHTSPKGLWDRVGMRAVFSGRADLLAGMFTATEHTGMDAPMPQAVGYGDIHTAFVLNLPGYVPELAPVKGKTLFNVGSVGNPMDMPKPVYAVLGGGAGLEVNLIRVPYDFEHECRVAVESGMPDLEEYLEETRFARYRPRGVTP